MSFAQSISLLILCFLYLAQVALVSGGHFWQASSASGSSLDLNAPHQEAVIPVDAKPEEVSRFREWQKSPLYAPSFDPKVIMIPEPQREFTIRNSQKTSALFREIVDEAIRIRNGLAPSSRLMLKYGLKILSTFLQLRREESKIKPRLEPKGDYFDRLADMIEYVLDESARIRKEKNYSKKSIDVEDFRLRTNEIYDYVLKILATSPVGGYMKFETVSLHMDDTRHPRHGRKLLHEAADLTAQFRAMGYETTMFVGRRMAKLMRMFAKGKMPDKPDDI